MQASFMPRGYVIPSWLREAFRLAKVPTNTISDYKALRKILSVNDLIMLTALQRINFFGPYLANTQRMSDGWGMAGQVGGSEAYKDVEYCTVISPAAMTEAIKNEARAQLMSTNSGDGSAKVLADIDDGEEYYHFELAPTRQYYLHIKPGILNALQDRTYALRFVSDYLKALYGFVPVGDVCHTPVFIDYLTLALNSLQGIHHDPLTAICVHTLCSTLLFSFITYEDYTCLFSKRNCKDTVHRLRCRR
jgi:hypothetical protein